MSKIFSKLNIFAQCKKYKIPLWQCPQFLFVIMGMVIMVASIAFYAIGERYVADPRIVALAVLLVTLILMLIAFVITQSFENLAEANRMKSEFVNIVSHQLRGPLTNLRWATQFLLSDDFNVSDGKDHVEYFNIIKENSARMEGLIDDLLTITRLKENRANGKKMKFALLDLIKEVLSDNKQIIKASNFSIEMKAPENLPKVFVSYPLAKIAIENLVGNALRYSPNKGKIFITLKALPKKIVFQIKDQGIGIPVKEQKHIFQKFFRARNAAKAEISGTGLGLFIVKMIVEGMNGKVWFTSKEDKGSTFYLSMPISN